MNHNRLPRFVLCALGIAIVVLVGLVVASIAPRIQQARRQAQVVDRIRALDGKVKYDFQVGATNAEPGRLQRLLGDDFFGRVVEVDLTSTGVSDNDLEILHELPSMTWLGLYNTSITDRGLQNVGKMHQLEFFWLDSTAVTDAGLRHLVGLRNLRRLLIQYTAISTRPGICF